MGERKSRIQILTQRKWACSRECRRSKEKETKVNVYGQGEQLIGAIVNTLETGGVAFYNLRTEQANLEDVFLSLTGREIEN